MRSTREGKKRDTKGKHIMTTHAEGTDQTEPPNRKHVVITPYAATQLVNKALNRAGVMDPRTGRPKKIGSPMLYIYAERGKFKATKAADGRWDVDRDSFNEWVEGYVEGAVERQQLREELAAED